MNDMELVLTLMNKINVRFINIDYHYIEVKNLNNTKEDERFFFDFDEDDYHLIEFGKYIRN